MQALYLINIGDKRKGKQAKAPYYYFCNSHGITGKEYLSAG
jgi:hypothetical protein